MTSIVKSHAWWIILLLGVGLVLSGCKRTRGPKGPAQAPTKELSVTGAGSALERVTADPVTEVRPTIAPDGKILLFEVRVDEPRRGLKQNTLVAVNPVTRAQRTLYTSTNSFSSYPAWLPDQSSYVYTSNSPGQWSLVRALAAAPNAAVTIIASGEVAPNASSPSVSPDGERVTFSAQIRGVRNVAVVGMDGSRLTLLGEGGSPSWSPDGSLVAFSRSVNGVPQLFLVDPDTGTGLVQLTSGEFESHSPTWSPDGRYLVFVTDRGGRKNQGRASNLFIIDRDGTNMTQLTDGDSQAITPAWGSDNWIYFASDQSGNFDIWRLRPAGRYANLARPAPAAQPAQPVQPVQPDQPTPPATGSGGCVKDTDCKGNRVCDNGTCRDPDKPTGE